MAKLPTLTAESQDDLHHQLGKIDLHVPSRGQGRSKDHTEAWSICRFLATYSENPLITYPLKAEHKDKPDLRLFMPSASVGIEITEAVDQQRAHHDTIATQSGSTGITDASLFRDGHPEYSKEEIRRIALQPVSRLDGPGWKGNEAEQGWVNAIMGRITAKTSTLNKENFKRFDNNWLVIYDNTVEQVGLTLDDALDYLIGAIGNMKSEDSQIPFDLIFVESFRHFLKIGNETSQDEILDLWKG